MIKRNRWRGRMPFRQNRRVWTETYEKQGRTGEPSFVTMRNILDLANRYWDEGRGKAAGSYTEHMRNQFRDWMNAKGMKWPFTITFEYRLYRHRIVTVVMQGPGIYHYPVMGYGSKGFHLVGRVISIDGAKPANCAGYFALSRIVGRFNRELLALTEGWKA